MSDHPKTSGDPHAPDPRKSGDASTDDLPGDAQTPTDAGPLESLGRAITSPVRSAEPEPGTPNVRRMPDADRGDRDEGSGTGGER